MCYMDLLYFSNLKQANPSRIIQWLQNQGLLANPLHCGMCNQDMIVVQRGDAHVDIFRW